MWVQTPSVGIKKATLTFAAKFSMLLVRNRVFATQAYHVLTWDRAAMVATTVIGLEIDFCCVVIAVIHERDFKKTTIFIFSCLIFHILKDSTIPFWHYDRSL